MSTIIKDGSGRGFSAKVDSELRLQTNSVALDHIAHESQNDGTAFVLSSGFVSITDTASFSAMMFIKNEDQNGRIFNIQRFRICSGGAMEHHATLQVEIFENSTGGTLISDANNAFARNMNLGFKSSFQGKVYSASASGKTQTGGTHFTQFINHGTGHSTNDYYGALVLAKDTSIAVTVKPSEAMTVCVEIIGYYETYYE